MVLSWGLPALPPAYVENVKQEEEASLPFLLPPVEMTVLGMQRSLQRMRETKE